MHSPKGPTAGLELALFEPALQAPFGFSTFSSFGHDKTHLGWAAGLYG